MHFMKLCAMVGLSCFASLPPACQQRGDKARVPSEDPGPPPSCILPEVKELVAFLDHGQCPTSSSNPECADVQVTYSKTWYDSEKWREDQTVLVIDSGLSVFPVTKYRSRIRNVFTIDETGSLRENQPSEMMPRYLDDFFEKLASFRFIPAGHLTPLSEKLEPEIDRFSAEYTISHGDIPFQFLAEHNPQASFVLLEGMNPFAAFKDDFCSKNVPKFKTRVDELANTLLTDVIEAHNVRYINFSAGDTPETIRAEWSKRCTGSLSVQDTDKFLEVLKPLYNVLFATPGVLGVQAGGNGHKSPLDCDSIAYPNRIRAGYFTTLESGLDPEGLPDPNVASVDLNQIIPPGQRAEEECLDVLVNFGIEEVRPFPMNETPYMIFDILGLSECPINFAHTSWAAPLVLSRAMAIAEANLHQSIGTNNDIALVKKIMTPKECRDMPGGICKYQDPLKHKQLNYNHEAICGDSP